MVLAVAGVYGHGRPRDLSAEAHHVLVAIGISALTLAAAILLTPLSAPGLLLAIFVVLDAALLLGLRLAQAVYRVRPGSLGNAAARPGLNGWRRWSKRALDIGLAICVLGLAGPGPDCHRHPA